MRLILRDAASIPTVELKIHVEKIPIALVMGTSTGWLVARFTIGPRTQGKAWCTTHTSRNEGDEARYRGAFPLFSSLPLFFNTTTAIRPREFSLPTLPQRMLHSEK